MKYSFVAFLVTPTILKLLRNTIKYSLYSFIAFLVTPTILKLIKTMNQSSIQLNKFHYICKLFTMKSCKNFLKNGNSKKADNEYTPWVNLVVMTTKPNGKIWICLNLCDLNRMIKWTSYYIRTINDIITKLNRRTHYFCYDFFDCCPHLHCGKLKDNISATVSSSLSQMSFVYLGIGMIQPGDSFLNFDCWSNKVF